MIARKIDIRRIIGERLREARKERGLSQRDLALLTDGTVRCSRISLFETGKIYPSIEVACALAKALGNVSAAYLLCVDAEAGLSAREQRLLSRFRAADETGRKTLLVVAEAAASVS